MPRPARTERRRRADNLGGFKLKLDVPRKALEELEQRGLVPCWVNEENLHAYTQEDDYDFVSAAGVASTDMGSAISRIVGKTDTGAEKRAYLCAKPRDFREADLAAEQAAIDEKMNQIRGQAAGATPSKPTAEMTYRPTSGVHIENG